MPINSQQTHQQKTNQSSSCQQFNDQRLNQQQQGRFISFEGSEGVGKTTAMTALCQRLHRAGIAHVRTREPGGSELAERLRTMLLDTNSNIGEDSELLLMFAARSDHLQQVILPALQAGQWVICDRFVDSTIAYQGFGRGYGQADVLAKIQALIHAFVPRLPDLSIWLDLPVAEGLARANKRGQADRFEQQTLAFFQRVQAGFAYSQQQSPDRLLRLDATGTADEVAAAVWTLVDKVGRK